MKGLERRVGDLERVSNPPDKPLVAWEGSPMIAEAEAAGREVIVVRWLRQGEAPADPAARAVHHGHA